MSAEHQTVITDSSEAIIADALDDGATPRNVVRLMAYALGREDVALNDDHIDFLLWERTAFPVCEVAHWLRQVRDELTGTKGET